MLLHIGVVTMATRAAAKMSFAKHESIHTFSPHISVPSDSIHDLRGGKEHVHVQQENVTVRKTQCCTNPEISGLKTFPSDTSGKTIVWQSLCPVLSTVQTANY